MTERHAEIGIQPLVNWPRTVEPGHSYWITVDLRITEPFTWPYDDEELMVGCMIDGRPTCRVLASGDAGVVLHRFGGSYGPAYFLAEVPLDQTDFSDAALWLTLTTAGGIPFYTGRLAMDGSGTLTIDATAERTATETGSPRAPDDSGSETVPDSAAVSAALRGRLDEAEEWYRRSLAINEELDNRPGMAATYHQLGTAAQQRRRLDQAEDWYRRALAINEELDNRPGIATTCAQLGLLAEEQARASTALDWNIRSVTLFNEFPSPMAGTGPRALARLTRQLGIPTLQASWQRATGQAVPQQVLDYITEGQSQPVGVA